MDLFEKNLAGLLNIYNEAAISLTPDELKNFIRKYLSNTVSLSDVHIEETGYVRFDNLPNGIFSGLRFKESEAYCNLLSIFMILYEADCCACRYVGEPSYQNALNLYYQVGLANSFIASSLMNYDFQQHNSINFNRSYHPNQDLCTYLENIYKTDEKLMGVNDVFSVDFDDLVLKINHKLDCQYIAGGMAFIKLQAVLLFLMNAPFYPEITHKIAQQITFFFKDFLLDARIYKIVVDNAHLAGIQTSGVKKTTCLKIFFSLTNTDRYCLRVDFPHDDKNYIHYNLHEPYRETGVPISIAAYHSITLKYGDLSDLFFEYSNQCWFRYDFLDKLNHHNCSACPEMYDDLCHLFEEQSHYHVFVNEYSNTEMTNFLIELSSALSHIDSREFVYGNTSDDDIPKILMKCKFDDILLLAVEQLQKLKILSAVYHNQTSSYDDKIRVALIHCLRKFAASETLPIPLPENLDELPLDEVLTLSVMLYEDVC